MSIGLVQKRHSLLSLPGIGGYCLRGNLRHPLQTIRWLWLGFYYGLRNIRIFWRAVWNFDTCDFTPMLELIRIASREMARSHSEGRLSTDWRKRGKELTVVSELCRRLIDDDYFENAGYNKWGHLSEPQRRQIVKHSEYMNQQDADYLAKLFRKVRIWWH